MSKKYLLIESTVEKPKIEIVKDYGNKVIFNTILQTTNDINRNKRYYGKKLFEEALVYCQEEIKNRNLVGELDHPVEDDETRQSTVLYKEVSHIITEVYWKNKTEIWGKVESTPYTPNGKTLTGLVKDKVKIGFSLRGFGEVIPRGEYDEVVSPLYIITWDCVSNPSHKRARIQEITSESMKRIVTEGTKIKECKNGLCKFGNYLDVLVENEVRALKKCF